MSREQTEKLLTFLGSVYPKLTEGTPEDIDERTTVWSLVMADIDFTEAKAAAVKYIRNKHYAPTPADIIALVKEARTSDIPTAEEAWKEVLSKLNPYQQPEWSHPIIKDAVRVMGFLQLCNSENPAIDRAQFIKIYGNLVERQQDRQENETVAAITSGIIKQLAACR